MALLELILKAAREVAGDGRGLRCPVGWQAGEEGRGAKLLFWCDSFVFHLSLWLFLEGKKKKNRTVFYFKNIWKKQRFSSSSLVLHLMFHALAWERWYFFPVFIFYFLFISFLIATQYSATLVRIYAKRHDKKTQWFLFLLWYKSGIWTKPHCGRKTSSQRLALLIQKCIWVHLLALK